MANFVEPTNPNFDAIRQIETNDPVLGGAAEIASTVNSPINYALRALVARTQWLKLRVEDISTPAASRSTAGIARLSSLAQVQAGQDDSTIVTPYLLQQKVNGITIPNASSTQRGIIELLTPTEARVMNDGERALTTALLKDILQNSSVARNIIRGLVPVNKYYTGSTDLGDITVSGIQRTHIANLASGESFMGGLAWFNGAGDIDEVQPLEVNGSGQIYIPRVSNFEFSANSDTWEYWTREN